MQALKMILQKRSPGFYMLLMVPILLTCFVYQYGILRPDTELLFHFNSDYLIYTPHCKLPNLDAWNYDAKKFYKKYSYISCSSQPLLSQLVLSANKTLARLVIDKKLVPKYSKNDITCCVSDVNRGSGKDIDNKIKYSKCRPFNNYTVDVSIEQPTRVTCQNKRTKKEVYKNVHMPIAYTPNVLDKQSKFNSSARPLSVLIIGIDSISRLNMIRTMPQTRALLLSDPSWIEYKIYHKIDDNTFPNLMAMLTGMHLKTAMRMCDPRTLGQLNKCDFMWSRYNACNYVTAYVEDSAAMSTFNYHKKGFAEFPTDYYARAYQLACSHLKAKVVDRATYCSGPEVEGERIWRLTQEFAKVHSTNPYFGFFWTNSYSHQELNTPTRMDAKVRDFMREINNITAENTVVLFLSDHGLRFGKIRNTMTGYFEDRLPFFFIRFPNWFREQFPEEYANIQGNQDKLVTPYDVYMTLQEILKLSGFDVAIRPAEGCPNCHSLFAPVNMNRSCDEANITTHWCTCMNYREVDTTYELATKAGAVLLDKIHTTIAEHNSTGKCVRYELKRVVRVYRSLCHDGSITCKENFMVVSVETTPTASFEGTVKVQWLAKPKMDSSGALQTQDVEMQMYTDISRLDSYSHSSRCTDDAYLKLLCYCK